MREIIAIPRSRLIKPTVFDEYFGLGQEESASPFLTPSSRRWAVNLSVKVAIVAAILLCAAFILSFFAPHLAPISFLLLVAVYFLAGVPSLIEAVEDLVNFDVNIDVLMTVAAFLSVLIGSGFEGGLLLVLFSLSGSIEDAVTAKAKGSLNRLQQLSPTKATVIGEKGVLLERSVRDISLHTRILVRAGEVVPLDGIVVEGISSVNLMHLTGESLPIVKQLGDEVVAGARNLEGVLTLAVTRTSANSTLSQIIQLVTQAHEARPQLQTWFERLSRGYALTIISLFVLFALTLPFIVGISYLGTEGSIYRALAFLIAASPCALILALPIAYLSAISACASKGILLKGGIVLDVLSRCTTIAFDKTGTLTTGSLKLIDIDPIDKASDWKREEIVAIAYTLEKNVVHPIARAISERAVEQGVLPVHLSAFKSIPGYGVEAEVSYRGKTVFAFMGRVEYLRKRLSEKQQQELQVLTERLYREGLLVALLFLGGELFVFSFQDTLREGVKETFQRIKQVGNFKLLMLTGDHLYSAKRVAEFLGIDEYYAGLLPEDKLSHISHLAQSQELAMVGDGINDAPALARASVGICMGKMGSGGAIDAADVVLLQDNLERLDWLLLKARQTDKIVRQNLYIAVGAIAIASFPALAGIIPLWLAVVMHEGGTVLVGLNALRLLR